jgi:D-glycero-D-manno-heptose 1,7-bisphosphate phosphatase
MNKGFFLDRDGVINIDHGYVYKVEDFEFVKGIFDLTKEAIQKGYLIFVITNQAGIGRGLYTLNDFNHLTNWMIQEFKKKDILLSKVYFSPYHFKHGKGIYKKDHISRKPNPGMIYQARDDFNIDLSRSILIGDKLTDIMAGQNSGIGTNILYTNNDEIKIDSEYAYHSVSSLDEVKLFLLDG